MQININGSKHRVPLNSIEWCCHNLMTNIEQRLPASLFIYHSGESCWSASYSKHNYYNTYTEGPLIRLWNRTLPFSHLASDDTGLFALKEEWYHICVFILFGRGAYACLCVQPAALRVYRHWYSWRRDSQWQRPGRVRASASSDVIG